MSILISQLKSPLIYFLFFLGLVVVTLTKIWESKSCDVYYFTGLKKVLEQRYILLQELGVNKNVWCRMGESRTCEPMKATSNGVFQGDGIINHALPLAIIQICLVVLLTRLLAVILRPLRQPRVIAEIVVSCSSSTTFSKLYFSVFV